MTKSIYLLTALTLVTLIAACKTSKKSTVSETMPVMETPTGDEIIFKFSQGACFGRCPVYDMTLTADSNLHLEGKNFINYMGYHKRKLNPMEFSEIMAAKNAIKLDTFLDKYTSDLVDLPATTYYFFSKNVVVKKIYTHGVYPEPLKNLQDKLFPYINKLGWEADEEMNNAPNNEVLIQLRSGAKIKPLIDDNARYKLEIKKTISESSGVYLIGFDSSTIELKQLINYLKSQKEVMYAQTNKGVSMR